MHDEETQLDLRYPGYLVSLIIHVRYNPSFPRSCAFESMLYHLGGRLGGVPWPMMSFRSPGTGMAARSRHLGPACVKPIGWRDAYLVDSLPVFTSVVASPFASDCALRSLITAPRPRPVLPVSRRRYRFVDCFPAISYSHQEPTGSLNICCRRRVKRPALHQASWLGQPPTARTGHLSPRWPSPPFAAELRSCVCPPDIPRDPHTPSLKR